MKFGVRKSSVVQSNADEIRVWLIKGTMMVDGLINHNNKKIFLRVTKYLKGRQPEKSNEDIGIGLGQTLRGWF